MRRCSAKRKTSPRPAAAHSRVFFDASCARQRRSASLVAGETDGNTDGILDVALDTAADDVYLTRLGAVMRANDIPSGAYFVRIRGETAISTTMLLRRR